MTAGIAAIRQEHPSGKVVVPTPRLPKYIEEFANSEIEAGLVDGISIVEAVHL